MISIIITSTSAVVSQHAKSNSRHVFSIPLNLDDGGMLGFANRCRTEFKRHRLPQSGIHITFLENIVYKEFTHMATNAKAVAGFAALEARTVLHDQVDNYLLNHISFGLFKNSAGEESSLLLAVPISLLKALQSSFASCGFKIESVHTGFDAYKTACERIALPKMGKKGFVAIDFSLEHTLINVYFDGNLASQRRLPGYATTLLPFVADDAGPTDSHKIAKMRSTPLADVLPEAVSAAIVSFLWDTLRTIRVVTAPLQLDIEEFFLSGEACSSDALRTLMQTTFELPCTFAHDLDMSAILCKNANSDLVLAGGACLSPLNLFAPMRAAKKNVLLDVAVCATLTIIVAIGFSVQPFTIASKQADYDALNAKLVSLAPVQAALTRHNSANALMAGIEARKASLSLYRSNVGVTHPHVEALFALDGLRLTTLSYDGETGLYVVNFVADTKEYFLMLKDTIYANEEYYLNLSLSSNKQDDSAKYNCVLSFIPSSYAPAAATTPIEAAVAPPPETGNLEDNI